MDSGFRILDSRFCLWYLDSSLHSLEGFRIPEAACRISVPKIPDSTVKICYPDSTIKNFPDSGIHGLWTLEIWRETNWDWGCERHCLVFTLFGHRQTTFWSCSLQCRRFLWVRNLLAKRPEERRKWGESKGYYFYSTQSSTVIKSKMAATTILRTRTRFRPPKIRLHCRLLIVW